MRVIELETVLLSKPSEVGAVLLRPIRQYVLETGRDQEVLLLQTQFLSVFAGVVGIQHHRDLFSVILRSHGLGITA